MVERRARCFGTFSLKCFRPGKVDLEVSADLLVEHRSSCCSYTAEEGRAQPGGGLAVEVHRRTVEAERHYGFGLKDSRCRAVGPPDSFGHWRVHRLRGLDEPCIGCGRHGLRHHLRRAVCRVVGRREPRCPEAGSAGMRFG